MNGYLDRSSRRFSVRGVGARTGTRRRSGKLVWRNNGRILQLEAESKEENEALRMALGYQFLGWRNHRGTMSWYFKEADIDQPTLLDASALFVGRR
jgi:hypothetical protein